MSRNEEIIAELLAALKLAEPYAAKTISLVIELAPNEPAVKKAVANLQKIRDAIARAS